MVAWLLAALRSHGPYPVLVLSGEPGSAKSTVVKILRSLVDPNHIPTRVFPATVGLNWLPDIRLPETPRMADFAGWAAACETACWPPGTFLHAYSGNRQDALMDVIESDPVAESIRLLVSASQSWDGSAAELLLALEAVVGERIAKSKRWPGNANVLSKYVRRVAPALRRVGIEILFQRVGWGRRICISLGDDRVTTEKFCRHHINPLRCWVSG